MCHPTCGLEINLRRLKGNRNVRVLTMAEVIGHQRQRAATTPRRSRSRRATSTRNCTACGDCSKAVAAEIPNPFNYGLDKMKAAYLPHAMAYPQRYVLDPSIIGTPDARRPRPPASTARSTST